MKPHFHSLAAPIRLANAVAAHHASSATLWTALGRAARLLPMLLLLTLPAVVQAQYNYTTNNGTITITGYTGSGGAVTIPSTINGLPVTRIGDLAFASRTSLTSVTIPNSVASIGGGAFTYCTSLTAITVDALNSAYSSVDGVLFVKSQTMLIQYPGGKVGSDYAIPNSVTSVGGYAFVSCTRLTSVTIPNSVTSIGSGAFRDCTSLTNVTIGNSVTNIGTAAFQSCTSLTSLTIPNSVTSIGGNDGSIRPLGAFLDCTSLTNVTIGNSVTYIGPYSFAGCTSLSSVTIPNSVTNIGGWAFFGCTSLTSVTIPNSVASIEAGAFDYCTRLTSVTIGNGVTNIWYAFNYCANLTAITVDALNTAYSSVDGVLFIKSQTTLIQFPGGKVGSYTIPNTVTTIGDLAFRGCSTLTSVTIPNSVTTIRHLAFSDCTSLSGVYFQGSPPSVDSPVFEGANKATVYYLPGITGWGATFAGRPTAQWLPEARASDADFGVRTNQFGFSIRWASDKVVVVEASPDLSNPVWTPMSTNTLTGGSSYFSDPQWTNGPVRFYRLRAP